MNAHRAAAVAAGIAASLVAVLLYFVIGHVVALFAPAHAPHGLTQQQIEALIERAEARLEHSPQDPRSWVLLARAQAVLGRFDKASAAYAKAVALNPDDAQLLADYADALGMAQGGLAGEPQRLVERALRADPENAKALALAGTIAFDRKEYALAAAHWERLRRSAAAGSEYAQAVQRNIDEALVLANGAQGPSTRR